MSAVGAGSVLGGWTLREKLGQGSAGEVWRAEHRDGREAAVKVFSGPLAHTRVEEGRLLGELSHPHIAHLIEARPEADPPYLVLELVGAGSLQEYLSREGLPTDNAIRLARQIAAGLAHAHRHDAVHGDLKPSNVLLRENGNAVLVDFGLAERVDPDKLELSLEDVKAAGTLGYLSPERREGEALDPADDLYALGVVLYEMLIGSKPVGLRPPSHLRPEVPDPLDHLVIRLLDRRADRPTAAEVVRELSGMRAGTGRVPTKLLPVLFAAGAAALLVTVLVRLPVMARVALLVLAAALFGEGLMRSKRKL